MGNKSSGAGESQGDGVQASANAAGVNTEGAFRFPRGLANFSCDEIPLVAASASSFKCKCLVLPQGHIEPSEFNVTVNPDEACVVQACQRVGLQTDAVQNQCRMNSLGRMGTLVLRDDKDGTAIVNVPEVGSFWIALTALDFEGEVVGIQAMCQGKGGWGDSSLHDGGFELLAEEPLPEQLANLLLKRCRQLPPSPTKPSRTPNSAFGMQELAFGRNFAEESPSMGPPSESPGVIVQNRLDCSAGRVLSRLHATDLLSPESPIPHDSWGRSNGGPAGGEYLADMFSDRYFEIVEPGGSVYQDPQGRGFPHSLGPFSPTLTTAAIHPPNFRLRWDHDEEGSIRGATWTWQASESEAESALAGVLGSFVVQGNLSPLHPVGLTFGAKGTALAVTSDAKHVAWSSPSLSSNRLSAKVGTAACGVAGNTAVAESDLAFMRSGGFVYFDASLNAVQCQALLPKADGRLCFGPPQRWLSTWIGTRQLARRFVSSNFGQIDGEEQGFESLPSSLPQPLSQQAETQAARLCWIRPNEVVGGGAWLPAPAEKSADAGNAVATYSGELPSERVDAGSVTKVICSSGGFAFISPKSFSLPVAPALPAFSSPKSCSLPVASAMPAFSPSTKLAGGRQPGRRARRSEVYEQVEL